MYSKTLNPLVKGDFVVYEFTVVKNGGKIAYTKMKVNEPSEIYLFDGVEVKLTRFNEYFTKKYKLQTPQHFTFKASDNVNVEGWILPPLEEVKRDKNPAVVFIHGGSKGSYGYSFNFIHQLLASKGYVVIYSNPRGSDGYSEEFADIRRHYGERDYKDIMEMLDYVLSHYEGIDENNLAVTGISYGSFMTNWIVTQTNRFKAAISENGISNWRIDFGTSDIGYFFDPDQIGDDPWSNSEGHFKCSPINYVKNVKTPIMLIHSMEDYRCYVEQSIAFHVALRYFGKESRLIMFTKGSHAHSIMAKPKHRLKRFKLILRFLDEKLKKK